MRVHAAAEVTRVYDPDTGVITVPAGLCPALTLRALRAVMAELCLPCEEGAPLCWCGAPLDLAGLTVARCRGKECHRAA